MSIRRTWKLDFLRGGHIKFNSICPPKQKIQSKSPSHAHAMYLLISVHHRKSERCCMFLIMLDHYHLEQAIDEVDEEGLLIFLDIEKAFDSVSWDYMLKATRTAGMGPSFRR